jgi:multisubunit Na+/H+ antiporter MnhF subunit
LCPPSGRKAPIPADSVQTMVLGHLTPNEVPFELVLILVGFVGGVAAERFRRVRARRR